MGRVEFGCSEENYCFTPFISLIYEGERVEFVSNKDFKSEDEAREFMLRVFAILTTSQCLSGNVF
jgi:hypothetical protein